MKNDTLARDWDHANQVGPGSPLTTEEWRKAHNDLQMHAKAMSGIMNDLARRISGDAGLDPNLLGIHPNNAMAGKEHGQPWEGVDYNRVQVVLDLLAHEFDANRMVDAFDKAVRLDPHQRWLEANRD